MSKKIVLAIFAVLVILAAGGGFFWWWQDQRDVRELNKDLPEGVRVVKNFAREYRVVNKIDGYELRVPTSWKGVGKIQLEKDILGTEFSIENNNIEYVQGKLTRESHLLIDGLNPLDGIEIRSLTLNNLPVLGAFVDQFKEVFTPYRTTERLEFTPVVGDFTVGELKGVKLYTTIRSLPDGEPDIFENYYFLSTDSKIYIFLHFNDELIREIIANGKW